MAQNLQVLLAKRPIGDASLEHFRIASAAVPTPGNDEVLVKTLYLSIDPYLLRLMKGVGGYSYELLPDKPMHGRLIGEVVESRNPDFAPGEQLLLYGDWQHYNVARPEGLVRLDTRRVPGSAYLGVIGRSGLTAWVGLLEIGRPEAGQTVVVSSAAGAVGSVVGQIAKIKGCRAVGIAGGEEKCERVVRDFGFDACIDYKSPDFAAALGAALPQGADIHFENVGGAMLDAVLPHMNRHGRIAICGLVAHYSSGPAIAFRNFDAVLSQSLHIEGFATADHMEVAPAAEAQLKQWLEQGRLKYHETLTLGLESAPQAMLEMLAGRGLGKHVVKVADAASDATAMALSS